MPPDCDFRTTVLPQVRLMRSLKGMHLGCSLSCCCSKASNSSIGGRRSHKSPRSRANAASGHVAVPTADAASSTAPSIADWSSSRAAVGAGLWPPRAAQGTLLIHASFPAHSTGSPPLSQRLQAGTAKMELQRSGAEPAPRRRRRALGGANSGGDHLAPLAGRPPGKLGNLVGVDCPPISLTDGSEWATKFNTQSNEPNPFVGRHVPLPSGAHQFVPPSSAGVGGRLPAAPGQRSQGAGARVLLL